jgi:hypothetical protein
MADIAHSKCAAYKAYGFESRSGHMKTYTNLSDIELVSMGGHRNVTRKTVFMCLTCGCIVADKLKHNKVDCKNESNE